MDYSLTLLRITVIFCWDDVGANEPGPPSANFKKSQGSGRSDFILPRMQWHLIVHIITNLVKIAQ